MHKNSATESASQALSATVAERAAPKESQRLDWLIVGLDVPNLEQARPLVQALAGRVGALKIGPVLFTRAGPAAIDLVHEHGGRVFLDLKWHDIPNTVAGALPRGGGAGRVDGQRARDRRRAHAGCRARGPGAGPATRHRAPSAHRRNRPDQPRRRRPASHRRHRLRR